ncbi:GumC family protein [Undibacterium oligocarboniphilum]|nr:Wzz/FepE/Etk N-terminal domain-containing protein [Undibacterium oligocarboniphilum]
MMSMVTLNQEQHAQMEDDDGISLMDILLMLAKHKKKIILYPIGFAVAGLLVSLILPNAYKANTKILPPQQSQSTASAMLSQLGGLAGGAGVALGLKSPNDLYIGMLKSRTITDKLIQRFDLQKRYGAKFLESARKQLDGNASIVSGKDNIISIDVEDKDPKIAAAIANAYVEELMALTGKFALTEASQRRIFFEKQLELTKDKMISAEMSLANTMSSKGMLSVDAQSKAVLETVARLRAGISAKEIQLKSMQAFVTQNNNEYKRANQELLGMRQELAKLENGSQPANESDAVKVKDGSVNNMQTLRDVKYYQMLYELLVKQYEVARLDEAKDAPLIQVLDKAVEPEYKVKPQRSLITIAAAFFGLMLSFIIAFVSEALNRSKNSEEQEKWRLLKSYF